MRSAHLRAATVFGPLVVTTLLVAGCSSGGGGAATPAGDGSIAVDAGENSCGVAQTAIAAGRHTFTVTNTASQVTEVYIYATGDRIMGEVENIGPATTRTLIVDLPAGDYQVACKPGMVGNGNRTALAVSGAAPPGTTDQSLQAAVDSYHAYVGTEAKALLDTTTALVAAIESGDLAAARQAYPTARLHYERIEPIAESLGDLDPLIDMRIDDATADTPFVGFHAIEQILFQKNTLDGAAPLGDALVANVGKLNDLVKTVQLTPLIMGNGAKSLLDEVAKSKVTGEEERYSRIDLVDFAGNVDGAKYVFTALRPALQAKNPQLVATLDQRFTALVTLLGTHQAKPGAPGSVSGSPYVSYDALGPADVKALAVDVDAISEPLGQISGVVTGP
ncbi:iron uptake system protein EfeO [Pseudonocardia sp. N23]|uniref:iron uptake system protein EfeO n=1 Tax=Pseudonocardia sp. N23 TaxID=1987376 RepID=UPI000BFC5C85|nr:iron uptake system protein EfeO [Pseudonocardia sp. N23]GAY10929.1 ferrous iron transport periplasmic protein EfeO [Pseudonocardia sp. N23]